MFRRSFLIAVGVLSVGCAGELTDKRQDQGASDATVVVLVDGSSRHDGQAQQDFGSPAKDGPGQVVDSPQQAADTYVPPDQGAPPPDIMVWPYDGSVGKPCAGWQDCTSPYVCTQNTHTGAMYCTLICDPCAADPCPSGTGCQNAGMAYICAIGYPNAPCPR